MFTYTAQVRVYAGSTAHMIKTQVVASSCINAQLLLKQQYGANNVISVPQKK